MRRGSGVLMPISALPSPWGIGCFSKEARAFAQRLSQAGQSVWQILPLGPTGFGDSPYSPFSTFAGSPYYIDLETLCDEGLLTPQECAQALPVRDPGSVDYEQQYHCRFPLLEQAFTRAKNQGVTDTPDYHAFVEGESRWLSDYALYMALKDAHNGAPWTEWEEEIRTRTPEALTACRTEHRDRIAFYQFLQYEFFRQWTALKDYANALGIRIFGDIPIYVAMDSADAWANPSLFALDEAGQPRAVAGCPPDGFSAYGQLWGNPLYDWDFHAKTGYAWWLNRLAHCFRLYDLVRIDHFRGFDEYYAIPWGDKTARRGTWMPGPGMSLFSAVRRELGEVSIVAEDLGFLTDSVRALLEECGYPGMKVLQFAFDSREESNYLPHNYGRNCVVYTGTHDNDTIVGWYGSLGEADRTLAQDYLNNARTPPDEIHWDYICAAMRSVADLCIIPMQDYLGLGSEGRINTPSTLGGNWIWRMDRDAFSPALAERIRRITQITGRIPG